MKTGPLNESELEWLDDILTKYNTDHAILDVAELDGLLTAVLSSPQEIEPEQWLVAVWGGADYVPRWTSEKEMTRFMNLAFQHMADTAERLNEFPEQFEPLFGLREVDGSELTIVEEWCFGYMRGVALSDWSTLPDSLKPALEAIALHGTEENFERVEKMSPEAFEESVDAIRLAALDLHAYWMAHPQLFSNRSKQRRNRGVTILVRAAVVRNLSSAACIKRSNWVSALILAPNKEFEAI